ncbi:hypothetical protein [Sorangium sp. So ce385]|uniref:hypothetical protein n=1 Tax=Sorangium sp. So ce385 TaxID=3133308 RepID=UPI003F5B12D3
MDPVKVRLMFEALIPPKRLDRVLRAASRFNARVRVQPQKKRRKTRKAATTQAKAPRRQRPQKA